MSVPIHFKFFGIEFDTEISLETANKIAYGVAGVAAGTAVIAAGALIGNSDVIKVGSAMAAASVVGTAGALRLAQNSEPERPALLE